MIKIYNNKELFAEGIADIVTERIKKAIGERKYATLVLTGGNTPKIYHPKLAERLAEAGIKDRLHIFWGDERLVPSNHCLNNYKLAKDTLLEKLDLPNLHVHRIPTEYGSPAEVALLYESKLRDFFGINDVLPQEPIFDVVILGVGADGHVASLFPGHKSLKERRRWVLDVIGPPHSLPRERITMTLPILNATSTIIATIMGEEKQDVISHICCQTELAVTSIPANYLEPVGEINWLIDRASIPSGWCDC